MSRRSPSSAWSIEVEGEAVPMHPSIEAWPSSSGDRGSREAARQTPKEVAEKEGLAKGAAVKAAERCNETRTSSFPGDGDWQHEVRRIFEEVLTRKLDELWSPGAPPLRSEPERDREPQSSGLLALPPRRRGLRSWTARTASKRFGFGEQDKIREQISDTRVGYAKQCSNTSQMSDSAAVAQVSCRTASSAGPTASGREESKSSMASIKRSIGGGLQVFSSHHEQIPEYPSASDGDYAREGGLSKGGGGRIQQAMNTVSSMFTASTHVKVEPVVAMVVPNVPAAPTDSDVSSPRDSPFHMDSPRMRCMNTSSTPRARNFGARPSGSERTSSSDGEGCDANDEPDKVLPTSSHVLRQRFRRKSMTALPADFDRVPWHRMACAMIVMDPRFDWFVSCIILMNAVTMGLSADHLAKNQTFDEPIAFLAAEKVFFTIFLVELLLRLNVFRLRFFIGVAWGWNCFDFCVIGSQLVEELLAAIGSQTLGFTGVLRLLRLARVIRLARILRLIRELRVLVSSISNSMKALVWTLLLMFLMIYSVSLCITQLVADHRLAHKGDAEAIDPDKAARIADLELYYGTLSRSMLSLFEAITGGIDWDSLVSPLLEEVHPLLALLFVAYVAVALLAIMNVVTGVFVDSVLASAKADKETYLLNQARELFLQDDEMDWDAFQQKLDSPQMLEFFKGIDVDPSEAKEIFSLIDLDDSGSVNAEEFLTGCVRLQGPSKALETAVLLEEIRLLRREVSVLQGAVSP